jgi:hypothetical protein
MTKQFIFQTILILFIISCTTKDKKQQVEVKKEEDTLEINEAIQEFNSANREGNRGDDADSLAMVEIEEFNNADYGDPGIHDGWITDVSYDEEIFLHKLKTRFDSSSLFSTDSLLFIQFGPQNSSSYSWKNNLTDLLKVKSINELINSSSDFSNNNLRYNRWHLEFDCPYNNQKPEGIFINTIFENPLGFIVLPDSERNADFLMRLHKLLGPTTENIYKIYHIISSPPDDKQSIISFITVQKQNTSILIAVCEISC